MAHILDSRPGWAWAGGLFEDVPDVTIEDVLQEWLPRYAGMAALDVVADIRRRRREAMDQRGLVSLDPPAPVPVTHGGPIRDAEAVAPFTVPAGTPCQPSREGGMCGCDEPDDGPRDCLRARCDC